MILSFLICLKMERKLCLLLMHEWTQFLNIISEKSKEPFVLGSLLGSSLFFTYINDLPSISDKLCVILYADNTVLSFPHPNFENMIQVSTCELEKVNKWLIINKFSSNVIVELLSVNKPLNVCKKV